MFERQRAELNLEEISGLVGCRPVHIVGENLLIFHAEMRERQGLLKILRSYLPIVTVVFYSRRAGEGKHKELLTMATRKKSSQGLRAYRVVWEIDIDAETPEAAAKLALQYQRDTDSHATHFKVSELDGPVTHVEL